MPNETRTGEAPSEFGTAATFTAPDLPHAESTAQVAAAHGSWRQFARAFDPVTARSFWTRWNPRNAGRVEDPTFLGAFTKFLRDGLELGYSLDRFCEVSARLPDPSADGRSWIRFFEDAIAGADCATVRLFLSREQHQAFDVARSSQGSGADETWDSMLGMMSDGLFYELGLVYRPISVQIDDTLSAPWFRCEWNDLCLPAQRGLSAESLLVNDTTARLALLNIKGERAVNPANGAEGAIIDKSFDAVANRAGLTTWDARGYAVLATAAMIRGAAGALVNRPLYELYNLRLREMSPDLISLVEETMDADFLVQILRGLLSEEIGVRDLSTIVEAALELRATISADTNQYIVFPPATGGIFVDPSRRSPVALSPLDYVEFVRTRLKRQISHKYTRGGNTLVVYLMDRGCEDLLARSEHVDPAFEAAITKSIHEEVGALPPAAQQPVILTAMNVRRRLRRVVSAEFPQLAVVSYQELSPDMNIQPIGRITVELPRPSP